MKVSDYIHQIIPLTLKEKTKVEEAFADLILQKGDFFAKEGKVQKRIGYIVSGKLRNFYFDDQGKEQTCFFAFDNTFIAAYTSFLTETFSSESIAAIENSHLKVISKKGLEELSEAVPNVHIFRRIMAETMYVEMEKRTQSLQSTSAAERYESTLKENPNILLNVPLQYTASFLGITPQHLSRLRKKYQN